MQTEFCLRRGRDAENGQALGRARELAKIYLKAPEVTRRNTRAHFIQPLKERIVQEVGYGLSLKAPQPPISSNQCKPQYEQRMRPAFRKEKSHEQRREQFIFPTVW
jgi:hypothetical protein